MGEGEGGRGEGKRLNIAVQQNRIWMLKVFATSWKMHFSKLILSLSLLIIIAFASPARK